MSSVTFLNDSKTFTDEKYSISDLQNSTRKIMSEAVNMLKRYSRSSIAISVSQFLYYLLHWFSKLGKEGIRLSFMCVVELNLIKIGRDLPASPKI